MAYERGRIGSAIIGAVASLPRPSFMRALAKTTLDYRFNRAYDGIHRVGVDALVGDIAEVKLRLAPQAWGATPVTDLLALCALVASKRPRSLFEFGTFTGNATLHLAMNAAPGASLFTLDIPPDRRKDVDGLNWEASIDDGIIGSCYRNTPYQSQITQLYADSRKFDTSPYRNIEFVWIDACHEYEFVANDSEKSFQMLAPDGIVAWHDFSRACPGVARYLSELSSKREIFVIDGTQVAFVRAPAA